MKNYISFHTYHTSGVERCVRCGEYAKNITTTPLRLYKAWCGGGSHRG